MATKTFGRDPKFKMINMSFMGAYIPNFTNKIIYILI